MNKMTKDNLCKECFPENGTSCQFNTNCPCPCHSQTDKCRHKEALEKSGITPPEGYICRACHPTSPLDSTGWIEEFDLGCKSKQTGGTERFVELSGEGDWQPIIRQEEIESFIKELLSSTRQEGYKEGLETGTLKLGEIARKNYQKGYEECWQQFKDLNPYQLGYIKARQEVIEKIIDEFGSNPNEDGSVSPNIQHWIEQKRLQLKRKFLSL